MEPVGGELAAQGAEGPGAADAPEAPGNGPGSPGAPDGEAQPGAPVDCYVLFRGHTDGLALFGALKGTGVDARISPTPRAARAECGMSLLVSCDDEERIRAVALACGAHIEGVARLSRQICPDRDRYC